MPEASSPADELSLAARLERAFFLALREDKKSYRAALLDVLDENVEYVDPVHEIRGAAAVADMLCAFADKVGDRNITMHTLLCSETDGVWT
jgi:hypothetical protein